MATYRDIPDSEVDQDSPVTVTLISALRDNALAIAEGAVDTPRVLDAALSTTSTGAGRDWVDSRIALRGAGGLSDTAFLKPDTTTVNPNNVISGSALRFSDAGNVSGSRPSGTWRCIGFTSSGQATVFRRVT